MIFLEVKSAKTKDGLLLLGHLPQELADSPSLELFPLRDGAYLLTVKGFVGQKGTVPKAAYQPKGALSEKEKGLVRKLLAIRFESRVPAEVAKALSREEKDLLDGLVKKEMVQVFHGGKYEKGGVYNVSDFAFNSVREPSASQASPPQAAQSAPLPVSSIAHLEKCGWMILENDTDARNFANAFPDRVKSGEVRGQRAFDRRYYFITRQFFESHGNAVQSALGKSDKTAEEVSSQLGIEAEGCRAILVHLLESGDVMEKKKGKFSRA